MMDVCVVCGDERRQFAPFLPGLKKCVRCGHCTADLADTSFNPHEIYGENYFTGDEYVDYRRDRPTFDRHFRSRLKYLKRIQPGGELIEVGCAYGFFLALAQQDYRVTGFDIAERPTAYAREQLGLDARCEDFSRADLPAASADVVVMWDTIEHLPRPDLMLQQAAHVLRPGGHLVMTTGDISSRLARWQGAKWRLIHPPTHLHYFTPQTLERLVRRVGLQPAGLAYVGVRRSVRQVAYSLLALGKPRPSPVYTWIANSALGDLSFEINTFDIMQFTARR